MSPRILVLVGCFAAVFGGIGLRLVDLGLPEEVMQVARASAPATEDARADLVDRAGRLLATTIVAPRLVADPRDARDPDAEAAALAAVLPRADETELRRLLASERHHVILARDVNPREIEAVRRLGLPAVGFEDRLVRVYPNGSLAAHLVGYVDIDNNGLSGAERAFDARLRAGAAAPLRLSLDIAVQAIVEAELATAIDRHRAKAGASLVMDATTGEILAAASLPTFDPHDPAAAPENARKNLNLTQTFELGSVFKLLTVGLGLEQGVIGLRDELDATRPLRIAGSTIGDYRARNRVLSVPEGLIYSSNIANARIGLRIGGERFAAFVDRIGFGEPLEFDGGVSAQPQLPPRWSDVAVATVAFGHGIAVTPLHYVSAIATLLTDGRPVQPTLLARQAPIDKTGEALFSPRVVETMRGLAWRTLEDGRSNGRVAGYAVGGKTGTAQKVDERGRYQTGVVRSSFVAVLPIDQPRYVVFTMLDEPRAARGQPSDRITGGWTSAVAVRGMVERIGPLLGVAPATPAAIARLTGWSGKEPQIRVDLEGGSHAARGPRG